MKRPLASGEVRYRLRTGTARSSSEVALVEDDDDPDGCQDSHHGLLLVP